MSLLCVALLGMAVPAQNSSVDQKFRQAFAEALSLNEPADLEMAIKRQTDAAVRVFLFQAGTRAVSSTREINRWVDAFIEAWNGAYGTDFARNYDRYLQSVHPVLRTTREKLINDRLVALDVLHGNALRSRDREDWNSIQERVERLANDFRDCGDLYYEAYCWNILGNSWRTAFSEEGGNDPKALQAYQNFQQVRDRLGLQSDGPYAAIKKSIKELRARLGLVDPETGQLAERKISRFEIQPAEHSEWTSIPWVSVAGDDPEKIQHGCDLADSDRMTWLVLGLPEPGAEGLPVPGYEPPVWIKRVAMAEITVDGGERPCEPVRLRDRPTLVEFERRMKDGRVLPFGLWIAGGNERDPFQGVELNLKPNDQGATIFVRSAGVLTADTKAGPLRLFDHSSDGNFGHKKIPSLIGVEGIPSEITFHRFDSYLLGKGKHSFPYSHWIPDAKGAWWELRLDEENQPPKTVRLRKVLPSLGTLRVTFKGIKGMSVVSLLLKAETSQLKGLFVDVAAGKKGKLAVPIGRYRVLQGLLRGKGMEAVILPPSTGMLVDVEEGVTETFALGAPFQLTATPILEGKNLLLKGESLAILGRAGERYVRMVGAPWPNVEIQVKGSRAKHEMLRSDVNQVNANWSKAFFLQDWQIFTDGKEPSLRLKIKKHPWFGKLESDWIP